MLRKNSFILWTTLARKHVMCCDDGNDSVVVMNDDKDFNVTMTSKGPYSRGYHEKAHNR